MIGSTMCGQGSGTSKQIAAQAAARQALEALETGDIVLEDPLP